MSATSARIIRRSMALRPAASARGFTASRTLQDAQPPRSQYKPAHGGKVEGANMFLIGGVGVALGGTFFLLLSRPEKAIKASADNLSTPSQNPSTDTRTPPQAGNKGQDSITK